MFFRSTRRRSHSQARHHRQSASRVLAVEPLESRRLLSVDLTLEARVSAGKDDAEERSTGRVNVGNGDLELVYDNGGNQTVGIRFRGLDLPAGATIVDAFVQFQADETNSGATSLTIEGQDSDDAPQFTDADNSISSRPRTSASIAWSPPPWTSQGDAGIAQRTPNLAPVIQEIVGRPGWTSGNALALVITGTGERVAESYEGGARKAALLSVTYRTGVPANTAPVAANDSGTTPQDSPLTIDVLANDDDVDGDPLSVTSVSNPTTQGGTAEILPDDWIRYTPPMGFAGTDSFTYNISDGQGGTDSANVTVTVDAGPGGTNETIERRVDAGFDDAEEDADGSVNVGNGDLELVYDSGGNQTVGIRFKGLDIPAGATIVDAFVQFQADETNSKTTSLTINGQDSDDAARFTNADESISSRPRTSASVGWSPPPWTSRGDAGSAQRTPNLAPVIQEIVGRPGWSSGNALALIITGTGERVAESYEGGAGKAPRLSVTYRTGAPANNDPVAANDSGTTPQDSPVTVDVLANDGDVDGDPLSVTSVSSPTTQGGTAVILPDDRIRYTPPAGFAGTDTFSYNISDGQGGTDSANVTVTVFTDTSELINADFNSDADGFVYADDTFRGTSESAYAMGTRISSGGLDGGALKVTLGGVDNDDIYDMSGGWQQSFSLAADREVTVSLNYNLTQTARYEADEFSQALFRVDGLLIGEPPADYLAEVVGVDNGGGAQSTGWQLFQMNLGTLTAVLIRLPWVATTTRRHPRTNSRKS